MSRTRVIYLSVLAGFLLVLLAIVIYYLIHGRIFADSLSGTEIARQSRSWDLNSNGVEESVFVIKYRNGSRNNFILTVIATNNKKYSLNLSGFEDEVSFCPGNELVTIDQQKVICLSGYVGVHSENIQLVEFNGVTLKPIRFLNDESVQDNIFSDAPAFGFKDVNNDNLIEFYTDNRNYDKDPVLDTLRSYYYFIDGAFRFNNVESIHYNEQISGDGRIN